MDKGRGNLPVPVRIVPGSSWKLRAMEIHRCDKCGYEYSFPRHDQILKIAEARTGRCSEWSMLFGAIMNASKIETRIVHDSLITVGTKLSPVHMDSTLEYPLSLDHPHYYEQNWGKKYEYVLAFSNDRVEDVTQTYTQNWDAVIKRREEMAILFQRSFSNIRLDFYL